MINHNTSLTTSNSEIREEKMAKAVNLYGDGNACEKIADILGSKQYQEWKN